ncbi:MAG: hypothetical protein ABSE81_02165 [Candidatus Omnitrophota bacterium]|jgi:pimeloyl-[acyl-carrier protein] methyl ester esterase
MLEIKFVNRGFKDNLVLIPGWATDYRIFQPLELNYNYLLVSEFSPFSFTQDLSQYLKSNSIAKISILGWSLGGFLAADFTVRNRDNVEQLILLGMREKYKVQALTGIEEKLKKNRVAWLYKFYLDCFSRNDRQGLSWFRKELLKDYLKKQELLGLIAGLDYLSRVALDINSLKQIESLRIFHGSADIIAPLKEALAIKAQLPKAEFVSVQKVGHALFLSSSFKDIFHG